MRTPTAAVATKQQAAAMNTRAAATHSSKGAGSQRRALLQLPERDAEARARLRLDVCGDA
jgi:hypothetical protein